MSAHIQKYILKKNELRYRTAYVIYMPLQKFVACSIILSILYYILKLEIFYKRFIYITTGIFIFKDIKNASTFRNMPVTYHSM